MIKALAEEKDSLKVLGISSGSDSNKGHALLPKEQECLINKLRGVFPIINNETKIIKKGLLIQVPLLFLTYILQSILLIN